MGIECLVSEEIFKGRGRFKKRIVKVWDANHFKISRRRFNQFFVNPAPDNGMTKFPENTRYFDIEIEGHAMNVSYTVNCLDINGNNLKTYYF